MKVAAISVNLGSYDTPYPWVEQIVPDGVELIVKHYNDSNFPLRTKAMTARLQCAIPKMFGWQLIPGCDYYVWLDSSCTFSNPHAVWWFVEQCQEHAFAICKHPERNTLREEYEFMSRKLAEGNRYLCSRYEGEWLDGQWAEIKQARLEDDPLYATTAFCYQPRAADTMRDWWYQKTRYLLHDQIGFTWAAARNLAKINALNVNIYNNPYFTHTRNRTWAKYSSSGPV